jgi:phosphotransferase system HPr-like phosphotransfer protein
MSLCIKYGDKITIIFQGEDEREALRSAKTIMKGLI